jgi:hypothetical protein
VAGMCRDRPAESEAIRRQVVRFRLELMRAELRESLSKRDGPGAVRVLRSLSATRGGWLLPAVARLAALWPQTLLWAHRVRRAVRT